MEITKGFLKKTILVYFVLLILYFVIEYYLYNYYLDDVLFKGYYHYFISENIFLIFSLITLEIYLISLLLIYFFKPIGKQLNLYSFILLNFIIFLMGDTVSISAVYPIDDFLSFLEIFILYIIYFTPLKKEFNKNNS